MSQRITTKLILSIASAIADGWGAESEDLNAALIAQNSRGWLLDIAAPLGNIVRYEGLTLTYENLLTARILGEAWLHNDGSMPMMRLGEARMRARFRVLDRTLEEASTGDWTTWPDSDMPEDHYPYLCLTEVDEPGRGIKYAYTLTSQSLDTVFRFAVSHDGLVSLYESDMHYYHATSLAEAVMKVIELEVEDEEDEEA